MQYHSYVARQKGKDDHKIHISRDMPIPLLRRPYFIKDMAFFTMQNRFGFLPQGYRQGCRGVCFRRQPTGEDGDGITGSCRALQACCLIENVTGEVLMANNEILHMVGFSVGDLQFCIDILKVQEIIRMVEITKMPNTLEYVEEIINLRGRVIPIIDFRKRCNPGGDSEWDPHLKRIVVAAIVERTIGLVVDKVSQVLNLEQADITPSPDVIKGLGGRKASAFRMESIAQGRSLILG
jgi:purine-binding chemotaxis protein CheW